MSVDVLSLPTTNLKIDYSFMKGYIDHRAQIDQSNQTKKVVEDKFPRVFKIGTFVCLCIGPTTF